MTQSNNLDVAFYLDEYRFSIRCSVFLRNKHGDILVQKKKTDSDDSWALPGGKLKIGESVIDGITREIVEEFAVLTTAHKFLGVMEQNIIIGNQRIHEHNYIYKAEFVGNIILQDETLDWKWMSSDLMESIKPNGCFYLINKSSVIISNGFA